MNEAFLAIYKSLHGMRCKQHLSATETVVVLKGSKAKHLIAIAR